MTSWLNVSGSFIEKHIDRIRTGFVALWILISLFVNWKSGTFIFNYFGEGSVDNLNTNQNLLETVLIGNDTNVASTDAEVQSSQTQFGWKIAHFYSQIANILFVVSNIQMDILYLRLFMITANLFLFLWGGLVLSTALDVVLYSLL